MRAYLSILFYKRYFFASRKSDWLPWVSVEWRLQTLAQLIQWDISQLSEEEYGQRQ